MMDVARIPEAPDRPEQPTTVSDLVSDFENIGKRLKPLDPQGKELILSDSGRIKVNWNSRPVVEGNMAFLGGLSVESGELKRAGIHFDTYFFARRIDNRKPVVTQDRYEYGKEKASVKDREISDADTDEIARIKDALSKLRETLGS